MRFHSWSAIEENKVKGMLMIALLVGSIFAVSLAVIQQVHSQPSAIGDVNVTFDKPQYVLEETASITVDGGGIVGDDSTMETLNVTVCNDDEKDCVDVSTLETAMDSNLFIGYVKFTGTPTDDDSDELHVSVGDELRVFLNDEGFDDDGNNVFDDFAVIVGLGFNIYFDQDEYALGDTGTITVEDFDIAGVGSVYVEVCNIPPNGDPCIFIPASEVGMTGVFTTDVKFVSGPHDEFASPPELHVVAGNIVTATYFACGKGCEIFDTAAISEVTVVERAFDYQIVDNGDGTFTFTAGLPDCIPETTPDEECDLLQVTQQGTGTTVDVLAGLIGAHFDTAQPVATQVCFFTPDTDNLIDDDTHPCSDHSDNPVFETWDLLKDGMLLTPAYVPSIAVECDGAEVGEGDTLSCEDEIKVTRTLSYSNGGLVAECDIEYIFTNVLNHIVTCDASMDGSYKLKQTHQWDTAAVEVVTADGTEQSLTQLCKEANLIDLLKQKVKDLQNAGLLNSGNANSLIKHLDSAKKELSKSKPKNAVIKLNSFIKEVNGLIKSKKLSLTNGQMLIDAANNIIANINNPVGTTCTLTPLLSADLISSLQFNAPGDVPIILENLEGKIGAAQFLSVTPNPTSVVYEYGTFVLAGAGEFELDPATSTLTGATADGQVYATTSTSSQTTCGTTFSKDTTSSLLRALSSSVGTTSGSATAPVCARGYMQWSDTPIPDTATINSVSISFTTGAGSVGSGCEFTSLVQSATAPGSRSASTLWSNIGGPAVYSSSCSSSLSLPSSANTDLQGKLVNNWFAVGVKLSTDTPRDGTTEFFNINSANSSSKPILTVVYTP